MQFIGVLREKIETQLSKTKQHYLCVSAETGEYTNLASDGSIHMEEKQRCWQKVLVSNDNK